MRKWIRVAAVAVMCALVSQGVVAAEFDDAPPTELIAVDGGHLDWPTMLRCYATTTSPSA
ncbi:hypothetical protein NONI108955_19285 [Nocardia ninae]|uniref:Uncharacterized protein n=1 Tax=Nocardia ninae NBRC 108245 TaxID=1210091 RepID=A0A511M6M6_9NOCA|nr:hypothetical protein [Nocardia ninae]GEM36285.1 hypothetical protein NN4_08040 [Nocardia ninae NBRC 108245]